MIENGMRYLRGYVKIQIQGYSPERFLNLCSYHHILIWGKDQTFCEKDAYKSKGEREIWISVFSL